MRTEVPTQPQAAEPLDPVREARLVAVDIAANKNKAQRAMDKSFKRAIEIEKQYQDGGFFR